MFSKNRTERALFYKKKDQRGIIYLHVYILCLSASGRHGLGLMFVSSALSPGRECAVGAIGTPPRPLYQAGIPIFHLLGALDLTAHAALGQMKATP